MSKESFVSKLSDEMYLRIKLTEGGHIEHFLRKNGYFELVLCLAYMTLSKEKIIDKKLKFVEGTEYLTSMVDVKDIDRVFEAGFCERMPNIISAKKMDNTWILDNFRDSIMHGMCDIDEERECFIINNGYYDRDLVAEIPFEWFIAYAKYDILNKKVVDKHRVRGFYYNANKANKKHFVNEKEVINNILYNVDISGAKFNINDVETRIKEIFDECSKCQIEDSMVDMYRERIDSEFIKYNEKYLVSFYRASSLVKEKIEKEFPGVAVNVRIDNRRGRLKNKFKKIYPSTYHSYDLVYESLNNLVRPKDLSLLKYISNIIEGLDKVPENFMELEEMEKVNFFNSVLRGSSLRCNTLNDVMACITEDINLLKTINIHVYGIVTLAMNQENLYNPYFLDKSPSNYELLAYTKKPYLEYANREKKLVLDILDKKIKIFKKEEQLRKCPTEDGRARINRDIERFEESKNKVVENLNELAASVRYIPYNEYRDKVYGINSEFRRNLDLYCDHFQKATTVEGKTRVKNEIRRLFDERIAAESEYRFSVCDNMIEVLTIIRNSLAHIGRITLQNTSNPNAKIILSDYDGNHTKSGEVRMDYYNLVCLLKAPFYEEKVLSKVV